MVPAIRVKSYEERRAPELPALSEGRPMGGMITTFQFLRGRSEVTTDQFFGTRRYVVTKRHDKLEKRRIREEERRQLYSKSCG